MRTGLFSQLIPAGLCFHFPSLDVFWDVIQRRSIEVDFLPGYNAEMAEILFDYLASDCGVSIPLTITDIPGANVPVVAGMHRHEATVLRTQLQKMGDAFSASSVFDNYLKPEYRGGVEWLEFFQRQASHFTSDDERLLILAIEPDIAWHFGR